MRNEVINTLVVFINDNEFFRRSELREVVALKEGYTEMHFNSIMNRLKQHRFIQVSENKYGDNQFIRLKCIDVKQLVGAHGRCNWTYDTSKIIRNYENNQK